MIRVEETGPLVEAQGFRRAKAAGRATAIPASAATARPTVALGVPPGDRRQTTILALSDFQPAHRNRDSARVGGA